MLQVDKLHQYYGGSHILVGGWFFWRRGWIGDGWLECKRGAGFRTAECQKARKT